jgi:uncharacterized protein (DUF488 family)
MYYRRKILLSLFENFNFELGKIDIQKLSFLVCRIQGDKPSFDFIPYKFGCYSYQIGWDLKALHTYGYTSESENKWKLIKNENFTAQLTAKDQLVIKQIVRQFKTSSAEDLMRHTYKHYPYYAINSTVAKELLTTEEYQKIENQKPFNDKSMLYSIGYEGISLETYFNKLIINDVKILCDVRRNPISQKVGFSKSTLQKVCVALGIEYVHIPELGIQSDKRQNLKTQKDYDLLFADYEANQLVHQTEFVAQILALIKEKKRVAITCFEANYCQCHRSKVAIAACNHPEWTYSLKHL